MNRYLFQIKIEIHNVAVVLDTVCIVANNRSEAQQGANRLAFDWWGLPVSLSADANSWRVRCEECGDAVVSAEPKFMCCATKSQQAFLVRACGPLQQLKAKSITDEDMIDTIHESQEYGMDDVEYSQLVRLFGKVVADRLVPDIPADSQSVR